MQIPTFFFLNKAQKKNIFATFLFYFILVMNKTNVTTTLINYLYYYSLCETQKAPALFSLICSCATEQGI